MGFVAGFIFQHIHPLCHTPLSVLLTIDGDLVYAFCLVTRILAVSAHCATGSGVYSRVLLRADTR
jgi:hypothetical protein